MRLSSLFLSFSRFFLPPAVLGLLYLYYYPAVLGCRFPVATQGQAACIVPGSERPARAGQRAPFRLLALADPQLEGNTVLPDPNAPAFPSLQRLRHDVRHNGLAVLLDEAWPAVKAASVVDLPQALQGYRKRLDLLGNDYYLAHIYRSMKWWTEPTHVTVLGDLLGSQWIDDAEFDERARRFWQRVFSGAQLVPRETTATSARVEVLGQDKDWSERIIAIAGNHDIGYAGDIDSHRIARFEDKFGHVNWETRFRLHNKPSKPLTPFDVVAPELRVVVLNSMNLDEPVQDHQLRDESLMFLGRSFSEAQSRGNKKEATILLTHIPLHKEAGVCVDDPLINYFLAEQGGGIREQNHLRPETSQRLLHGLGPRSIILNGHDHEGCTTMHYHNKTSNSWGALGPRSPTRRAASVQGIREITVRSMMGSFGGNAGLLSAWFDAEADEWQFEYATCVVGIQHIWWAVHVLAILEVLFAAGGLTALLIEAATRSQSSKQKRE